MVAQEVFSHPPGSTAYVDLVHLHHLITLRFIGMHPAHNWETSRCIT